MLLRTERLKLGKTNSRGFVVKFAPERDMLESLHQLERSSLKNAGMGAETQPIQSGHK